MRRPRRLARLPSLGGQFDPRRNRGRPNALACPGRAHGFAQRGALRPSRGDEGAEPLTPAARGGRGRPPTLAPRGARLRATGCARLRGRPVSRAQRGPRRSLQDGHDSRAGSAADGPRDVPARVLQERRFYAALLPRGPSPAGLHSTGLSAREGGSRGHDSRSGLAWPVPQARCEPASLTRGTRPKVRFNALHSLYFAR